VVPIFCDDGLLKVFTTNQHLLENCFKVWWGLFIKGLELVSIMLGKDGGMSKKIVYRKLLVF
jgi:hypothetical protein